MRFDSGFKETSGQDPRGLLHMVGRLRLDEPATVNPFEREVVAPQKIADSLFRVRTGAEPERFEQLEALTRWHGREREAILQRAGTVLLLRELDDAEFHLTVVLLSQENAPAELPTEWTRERAGGRLAIFPRYVRMWELDGEEYVRLGRLWLLPWVPLMRSSRETVRKAAIRIQAAGDESVASQFVTLGSLCYSKDELRDLVGRIAPMFTTELAMKTPFGQEILNVGIEKGIEQGIEKGIEKGLEQGIEQGIQQGLAQGFETGRRQEIVRVLRLFLRSRYPALAELSQVGDIANVADPEAALDAIYRASDEAAARAILQSLTV
ncbi:MAG: hypothetical protein U0Q16_33700 [Bryobacteraceae bacterium]